MSLSPQDPRSGEAPVYENEKDRRDDSASDGMVDGKVESQDEVHIDNAFSNPEGENYRTLSRWQTGIILITNQVGLGILSLPGALQDLGIVPGIISILAMATISTYTAYVLLQYYLRYPFVVNMMDQARVLGGAPMYAVTGVGMVIKLILTCGSTAVSLSVALNSMSQHGICTVGFIAIPVIACWLLCLPRTFKFVSHVGIPSTVSIFAAVLITIITLGVAPPQNAPEGFSIKVNAVNSANFKTAVSAWLRISYSYAGNVGFPSVMAEMKDPGRDFLPALGIMQAFSIPLYLITAVAIYATAGQYATSPALGSAAQLPAKIAYGIAFPALLATGLVFGHTAIKLIYVQALRFMKAEHQLTDRSKKSWGTWFGCTTAFWVMAFILAGAIPVFDSILAVSSATFVAWFTYGMSALFWFHLNHGSWFANWKKISLFAVNTFIIIISLFMNSAGLYSAISALVDVFNDPDSKVGGSFSCGDNGIL